MSNKLRAVKGQLPTKREIIDWPEEKILQLLKFTRVFLKDDSYFVDTETRSIADSLSVDEAYWPEFMTRIDLPLGTEGASHKKFRYRLMTMLRNTLAWLKDNPFAITDTLRAELETSKRFDWCLTSFAAKETRIGGEVVVMQNRDTTDPSAANRKPDITNVRPPQVIFNEELLKMTSVMRMLLQGIKMSDIKEMGTKDRIKTAVAMAATLTKTFERYKPNITVLGDLNVHAAERDELERALNDYQEAQVIDSE